jgi:hypothetical protein
VALATETVLMLEADVILSQDNPPIAIMGHPPSKISDITFKEWLNEVLNHQQQRKEEGEEQQQETNTGKEERKKKKNRKIGVKIDFKDPGAVEECLLELKRRGNEVAEMGSNFGIWLNSDILIGPGNNPCTFNPDHFIYLCKTHFPLGYLSLGWTTSKPPPLPLHPLSKEGEEEEEEKGEGGYSIRDVRRMLEVCKRHDLKEVTFPVRTSLVRRSWKELSWLLRQSSGVSGGYSLTVWRALSDHDDVPIFFNWLKTTAISKWKEDLKASSPSPSPPASSSSTSTSSSSFLPLPSTPSSVVVDPPKELGTWDLGSLLFLDLCY